jgi:hypothetical protein
VDFDMYTDTESSFFQTTDPHSSKHSLSGVVS